MALPHPNVVRQQALEIGHLAAALPAAYRTAHNMAYDKARGDEVPVKSNWPGDPTQAGATETEGQRRRAAIDQAALEIVRAFSSLVAATKLLNSALPDSRAEQTAPEKDAAVGDRYLREMRILRDKRRAMNWDPDSAEVG